VTGIELIAQERLRQVEEEGYTAEHDDLYGFGQLAYAGACYALSSQMHKPPRDYNVPIMWPWLMESWKPKTPLRDLIRAGALIAAEIDRLQRVEEKEKEDV
jgi:hypothetical protein